MLPNIIYTMQIVLLNNYTNPIIESDRRYISCLHIQIAQPAPEFFLIIGFFIIEGTFPFPLYYSFSDKKKFWWRLPFSRVGTAL